MSRLSLCWIAGGIFALLFAAAPVFAARSIAVSTTQIEGICSGAVDQMWAQNDNYWHQGAYLRNIAMSRIITEADPHFLEPYSTGGWLMESMGNLADAESYYQLGLTRNPDKSYMYYTLGVFRFFTKKDYAGALPLFEKDVTLPDSGVDDCRMLAHCYERTGQMDKAVAAWRVVKARYPKDPAADHNLAKDLALLNATPQAPAQPTPAPPATDPGAAH